ncbi:MAG TPA: alpha/beta hydrolase-fold protein [Anaerolineae bacterium]|jgi:hypothetical protein
MSEVMSRIDPVQLEDRRVFSHQVGLEYQLTVRLPKNYTSSDQHYPVFYVLDSDLFFGVATTLLQVLTWTNAVSEMIMVGIGYDRGMTEWLSLRERDFKIPEVQADPPDSHADRFLAVLKQELIPYIDANYRTDPHERTLFGYSSAGFFALYALANEPDLFQHYVAGSPDTDIACPYLLAHDQKLASHDSHTSVDLFLSVGELENGVYQSSLEKHNELATAIQTRSYPGLRLIAQIYPGEDHGVPGWTFTFINGIRQYYSTAKP